MAKSSLDQIAIAGWERKDQLVINTIWLCVGKHFFIYVMNVKSLIEAWNNLQGILESQGVLGRVIAKCKLYGTQCAEGTCIVDHIRTMKGYQEELHNLGKWIDGEEFAEILLMSLPDPWNTYIAALDTVDLRNLAKITARILEHDCCMTSANEDDMALAAKHGKKKRNLDIECFKCGKKGHIKSQCQLSRRFDGKELSKSPRHNTLARSWNVLACKTLIW